MRRGGRGIQVKGLKIYQSGGIEYVYHRASGIKLPALNHPDFLRAYASAEKNAEPRAGKSIKKNGPQSLEAAANALLHSDHWAVLKPATQSNYRRILSKLICAGGHVQTRSIKKHHIESDIGKLSPNPANARLRVWRLMLKFAKERGLIEQDPSEQIKKRRIARTEGHATWTVEHVNQYRNHWPQGSAPRIAMEILCWTGARVVDARTLGPRMLDDGYLSFCQEKTGYDCAIPMERLPTGMWALNEDMDHMKAALGHAKGHLVWITTHNGKPRSQKGLSQWLSARASDAGLPAACTAHGLRKYRDNRLAEAGLTSLQMRSWTGQQDLKTLELYIQKANLRTILEGPKKEQKLSKSKNS